MQNYNESKSKCESLFTELISKISRLRKRLVSCGYSVKEVIEIIFLQFLRLPQIDWKNLQETNNFYEVKTMFKVDTISAEVIMRLQKIVPNLHTIQVCEYLLTVLQLNASDFGFNLEDSSSDSNDSGSGMHRLIIKRSKRQSKNTKRQQQNEKRRKNRFKQEKMNKKVHHDEEYYKNKKVEEQVDTFFRNRPIKPLLTFEQEELEKQMKKMPQSQDSEHQ